MGRGDPALPERQGEVRNRMSFPLEKDRRGCRLHWLKSESFVFFVLLALFSPFLDLCLNHALVAVFLDVDQGQASTIDQRSALSACSPDEPMSDFLKIIYLPRTYTRWSSLRDDEEGSGYLCPSSYDPTSPSRTVKRRPSSLNPCLP